MSIIQERISSLRQQMQKEKIDAYFIPGTDPHQSEYVPECWLRRNWISGFTGSSGDVLITQNFAGLWTDSRYFLQAEEELESALFTLMKMGIKDSPSIPEYIQKNLANHQVLGVDPQVVSIQWTKDHQPLFEKKGIRIQPLTDNLIDRVWQDRPRPSLAPVKPLEETFTGESLTSKLERVREQMKKEDTVAYVLTTLDSIAWLFNIRGTDIPFNPVVIAYALITLDQAVLYLQSEKVTPELQSHFKNQVQIKAYEAIATDLKTFQNKRVLLDPKTTSLWIRECLSGAILCETRGPIVLLKALKNETEQNGMRQAHLRDGVALCQFFSWLETALKETTVTESTAADQLLKFRQKQQYFQGPSFETISGYKHHGAIVHYRVSPESDIPIQPEGIYLLDSGGQYLDGTTDVTRTVALGTPTPSQKEHFTRVLKGHITLDLAVFPEGTTGAQLDILARKALWDVFLDYGHGTGHGVGCYLNVHEGPQSISSRGHEPLKPGMVISNEPGYYLTGEYGIRIENLVLVEKRHENFLGFEPLTLCPIDRNLVDLTLITPTELAWLNKYHTRVYERISPFLNEKENLWLKKATAPLKAN